MSTAVEKTKSHERVFLPIGVIDPNENNPNEMTDAQFNMLYDNMERVGITDPILVRQVGDRYRVVGGHHRLEVAKLLDFQEVPCTVITDPSFDDDMEQFQLVRMNVIRGKMSPEKFVKMFDSLSERYSKDVLQESFGFVDEAEFNNMVRQTAQQLPPEMKAKFEQAAKEVRTIDGLAAILNDLFTKHGDSLPYGYMIFDFGGRNSIWLRMNNSVRVATMDMAAFAKENGKSVDSVVGMIFEWFKSEGGQLKEKIIAEAPEVVIPQDVAVPTLDFLDEYQNV